MDNFTLIRYFNCKTSAKEEEQIAAWLAEDPDGTHAKEFAEARFMWEGIVMASASSNAFSLAAISNKGEAKKSGHRWVLSVCAGIAAAIMVAFGSFFVAQNYISESMSENMLCASVPAGQTFELILEDGTSMFMNSDSKVEYPTTFGKKGRKVKVLQGEVLFDVAKDAKRPFVVETFASDIKVLGTKFNVEVDPANEFCATSLLRGSVRVDSKSNDEFVILEPDTRVSVKGGHLEVSRIEDAASMISWTKGLINLEETDFVSLMKKFEKAFGVNIVITRSRIPEIAYSRGKVRVSDGIDHALQVLQMASTFKYKWDYDTNTVYIY